MQRKEILQNLTKELEDSIVLENEPMKKHTSFQVGGPADIFIKAKTIADIKTVMEYAQKENIPLTVIGNGSNILVKDKGIRGIVLCICLDEYYIVKRKKEVELVAQSGCKLAFLAAKLLEAGIGGFEFASGIPGSIGGAIRMNAGAHGGQMQDIVKSVTYLDETGKIHTLDKEKLDFSYRHSIFSKQKGIIIEATFSLEERPREQIQEKMEEYRKFRKEKQPIQYPSAGSTFKRGPDFITAQLLDGCGLKGKKIGGAEISTLHAGFIINTGEATAKDILDLVQYAKDEVFQKYQKKIELEIEVLGE